MTDEWIKKIWYLYTMKFYSTIIMLFAGECMELENMLSEVSQDEKNERLHVFSHMWKLDL
jgi:hypothetical protein